MEKIKRIEKVMTKFTFSSMPNNEDEAIKQMVETLRKIANILWK